MVYDYMVVGQGLAGTLLTYYLEKAGQNVLVIDNTHDQAASKIAAGVINPITGRKYVKSWKIEELLPFADETYSAIGNKLETNYIHQRHIIRGLYSVKDENTWEARKSDPRAAQYIADDYDLTNVNEYIQGAMSFGVLKEGRQVDIGRMVEDYSTYLKEEGRLVEDKFDHDALEMDDQKVTYKGYSAKAIVFSEGYQVIHNPLFNNIAFEPAKGEVLLIRLKEAQFADMIRHKLFIVPLSDEENPLYWVGSGYAWDFKDDQPTQSEYDRLVEVLDSFLDMEYEIVEHIAGIRPSIKGRRPVLGRHPKFENAYIFNGLGTKGTSLGPYFAKEMVDYLVVGKDLDREVDVKYKMNYE